MSTLIGKSPQPRRVSRFYLTDLVREALSSSLDHPVRSLLTAIGTVLGAAAFVATLGITATVGRQVNDQFDAFRSTEVRVVPADTDIGPDNTHWVQHGNIETLRELNGVEAAGRRVIGSEISARRFANPETTVYTVQAIGTDPGALEVIDPTLRSGRLYGAWHEANAARVVLLPAALARQLGIPRPGASLFIGPQSYTVMGIYEDVARREEALLALLMPLSTSAEVIAATEVDVIIEVAPGAAATIASQAALALRPENPMSLQVIAPPDPDTFRQSVEADVAQLSRLLSIVAFAIGAVSIANSATASVMSRTHEIGLRRAIGARPRHIFTQLVAETSLLGLIGSSIGASLGLFATVGVAALNQWTPIIDLGVAIAASLAGAAAGLVAGLLPAIRATRIQPVEALRR